MRLLLFFVLAGCTEPLIIDCATSIDPMCPDAGMDAGRGPVDAGVHFDGGPDAGDAGRDADTRDAGDAGRIVLMDAGRDGGPCVFMGPEIIGDDLDRDENCDGRISCYRDRDNDGYRSNDVIESFDACDDPGEAYDLSNSGDCDDGVPTTHPLAPEIADNGVSDDCDTQHGCWIDGDSDGHRLPGVAVLNNSADADCNDPGEGSNAEPADDCDDTDGTVHPGSLEVVGDGEDIDEDCSGQVTCYGDSDGDRARAVTTVMAFACNVVGTAYASAPSDCDDMDASAFPGAMEMPGDSVDANCDTDEICFVDADSDGFRPMGSATLVSDDTDCLDPGEGASSEPATDCDDTNAMVSPGDTEIADNGLDDNCNGSHGCYFDADNDGYSRSDGAIRDLSTDADCADSGEGATSEPRTDCNDSNASVSPGNVDVADNGVDDNCSGRSACYTDADSDGYSRSDGAARDDSIDLDCADPGEGASSEPRTDCNDANAAVSPGDPEVPGNGIDDDCDGTFTDARSWERNEALAMCVCPGDVTSSSRGGTSVGSRASLGA